LGLHKEAFMEKSTVPPTPFAWRIALVVVIVALTVGARFGGGVLGPRGQAALGVLCFLSIAALFSANLRALNWRTLAWGFALQVLLALFVLKFEIAGVRPGYKLFEFLGGIAKQFLAFSDEGAKFVFGKLADPLFTEPTFTDSSSAGSALGPTYKMAVIQDDVKHVRFVFALRALPTIVFVSSFFSVLYYFGVLQFVVRVMARIMAYLMRTSGAETLSVTANVFMGQTEAPLMVKPYVEKMTQSELLALMVGGMAHISGALMAVYIGFGADPVAILATSVMASPCSLYMAKIMLPETGQPETQGTVKSAPLDEHTNVIDAAASGASVGMRLAINIAAMLIAFLAFIALVNYLLSACKFERYPNGLSLGLIFSWVFEPVAYLLGVRSEDAPKVADLLGTKLVLNEFVAYLNFKQYAAGMSLRTRILSTYALTGFANIASIGIQLGGIGAMAPSRRADLARLGPRALLTGFLVTLVNASIAGVLMTPD
jgi:CNT family concentrative nucleoside transporter